MRNDLIVWDSAFASASVDVIGAKSKGLGWLRLVGANVPSGFCVTTTAFSEFMSTPSSTRVQDLLSNCAAFSAEMISEAVTKAIVATKITDELRTAIEQAVLGLQATGKDPLFVVRSSFVSEDQTSSTSAGLYSSYLGVRSEEVTECVRKVWASTFSPNAIRYRQLKSLSVMDFRMAVLIQIQTECATGGILLSIDPNSEAFDELLIEVTNGHPSLLTGGKGDANRYVLSKTSTSVLDSVEHLQAAKLTDKVRIALVSTCLAVERAVDGPVDIEWCTTVEGNVVFLQVRRAQLPKRRMAIGPWIVPARDAKLKSGKVRIFKLSALAGNPWEADAVTPAAFESFLQNQRCFTDSLLSELSKTFEKYLKNGPVSIRPAYWSALNSGNMLPQSGKLNQVQDCLEFASSFWEFAITHNLNDYTSEVAFLVGNWIAIYASAIAASQRTGTTRSVVIHALYGFLEGLESNSYDVFEVSLGDWSILKVEIRHKAKAILQPREKPEFLSPDLAGGPVLTVDEALSIAKQVGHLETLLGPVRVEILLKKDRGPESALLWQVDPQESHNATPVLYKLVKTTDQRPSSAIHTGRILFVRNREDLEVVDDKVAQLIFVDLSEMDPRDPQFALDLALFARDRKSLVLLKGSFLSHFAATLRDFGIETYPVEPLEKEFENGECVSVLNAG